MKFSIHTLGCKVNQYESAAIAEKFVSMGYEQVPFGEDCDVCCINTCAVTEESVRKSCQMIRRAKKISPHAVVAVTGCVPQTYDADKKLPEADVICGNSFKSKVPELVGEFLLNPQRIVRVDDISKNRDFEKMECTTGEHVRAVLKVQDGCNNFCSYCIIPYARGRIRSKPLDEAVSEACSLINGQKKYRELVLSGIHLDNYGRDLGDVTLIDLIEKLSVINGLERIRLGSLEPVFVTEENVKRLSEVKNLCPHFHLSLQSGCEKTLKAMNRHYTPEEFTAAAELLRKHFPDCAITTDVIVGFPGETEEDFEKSAEFVKNTGFAKVHVFPFSERKGTRAAEMDGKVTKQVKTERAKRMGAVAAGAERDFYESLVGKRISVLFETQENGVSVGHTPNYAEIRVENRGEDLINQRKTVKITAAFDVYAVGEISE